MTKWSSPSSRSCQQHSLSPLSTIDHLITSIWKRFHYNVESVALTSRMNEYDMEKKMNAQTWPATMCGSGMGGGGSREVIQRVQTFQRSPSQSVNAIHLTHLSRVNSLSVILSIIRSLILSFLSLSILLFERKYERTSTISLSVCPLGSPSSSTLVQRWHHWSRRLRRRQR